MMAPLAWIAGWTVVLASAASGQHAIPLDLTPPVQQDLTPVITGGGGTQRCGCEPSVPGPEGGPTRYLVKWTCRVEACGGQCAYLHESDPNLDYPWPCNADCTCSDPPPHYSLSATCSPGGPCTGICVWQDPATGYKSMDVCHRLSS